jgi:hypothetical protein
MGRVSVCVSKACYLLFLIFAASSACASANVRTIAAATTANALSVGVVIEGSRRGAVS